MVSGRGIGRVAVVIVILEDMDPLEEDVAHMVVDIVVLTKDHVNTDIVGEIITSLRSAERNLIALNNHNWLILILLSLVILLMLLQLLFLVLPPLYFHKVSMMGCASSNSLRITIQQLMHPLHVWMSICLFIQTLDIRSRSLIPHDKYS